MHDNARQQGDVLKPGDSMKPFTPAPLKANVGLPVLESLDIRLGTIEQVDDVAAS